MTHVLDDLMQSLKTRVDAKYLSPAVLQEVDDINNANDDLIDQKDVMQIAIPFYQTCIDYLEQWKVQFEDVLIFDWAGLAAAPNWKDVETTIKFMVEKNWLKPEDNNVELFDEFGYILKFITPEKISEWNKKILLLSHVLLNHINVGWNVSNIFKVTMYRTLASRESLNLYFVCQQHLQV